MQRGGRQSYKGQCDKFLDVPLESIPLLSACVENLAYFNTLLKSSPSCNMLTTVGLIRPLGFARLKLVEFYSSLFQIQYPYSFT